MRLLDYTTDNFIGHYRNTFLTMSTSNEDTSYQEPQGKESITVPVVEEQVRVDVQESVTGTVRIAKTVSSETVEVAEPYTQENVSIERVAINEYVDELPAAVRYEGDVMIVPVLEEVLVKKTLLVEEIRITKSKNTDTQPEQVTLRKEQVEVQRD